MTHLFGGAALDRFAVERPPDDMKLKREESIMPQFLCDHSGLSGIEKLRNRASQRKSRSIK